MPTPDLPDDLTAEVQAGIAEIVNDADLADQRSRGQIVARAAQGDITFATDASVKAIAQAKAEVQVVALRVQGYDMRTIARKMGWINANGEPKVSSVNYTLKRALKRWYSENVEELRTLELERLDTITQRLWKMIEREGGKGDDDRAIRAIEKYMLVSDRRAKLMGLDAPKQVSQTFKGETTENHVVHVEIDMVAAVNDYLELVDEVVASEIRWAGAIDAPVIDVESTEGFHDVEDPRDQPAVEPALPPAPKPKPAPNPFQM